MSFLDFEMYTIKNPTRRGYSISNCRVVHNNFKRIVIRRGRFNMINSRLKLWFRVRVRTRSMISWLGRGRYGVL